MPPLFSVIMATYNRSNVLRIAIETVRWQTVEDWELWVVGDACTDDTEQVVASFCDPRIRFVNLERNVGDQSGPSNEGLRRSSGGYLAFLNHDDLWLPDHLETASRSFEETGADWLFMLSDLIEPGDGARLEAATPSGRYESYSFVPASCWVVRRETLEEVGPWKSARESHLPPEEELIFRARKAGKDIRLVPRLTVIRLPAGLRRDAYSLGEDQEERSYFERIRTESDFRERELTRLALRHAAEQALPRPVAWHLSRAAKDAVKRAATRLGFHPYSFVNFLRHGRRGGSIRRLRVARGLPPTPPAARL
jgi:glycosyltransferase involved in cell wall biosynthesis